MYIKYTLNLNYIPFFCAFNYMLFFFQVGFISEATKDGCSKSARILLTHLTSKYPHLLSNILREVYDNLEAIDALAIYLYEELPLSIWKVADHDLEIIARFVQSISLKSYF